MMEIASQADLRLCDEFTAAADTWSAAHRLPLDLAFDTTGVHINQIEPARSSSQRVENGSIVVQPDRLGRRRYQSESRNPGGRQGRQ